MAALDLSSVLVELGRPRKFSVVLLSRPLLNGAALAAGIVHKLFLFYAPTFAGEIASLALASESSSSSATPTASHAAVRPDFAVELLARLSALTCSVATDILFCQAYPVHFPVIGISARRGSRNAPRCNPIPGWFLFGSTGFARSRTPPRALDRRSRLCPLPISCSKAWSLVSIGRWALLHLSSTSKRRQAFSEISTRINLRRWHNGALPCRTTTV